MPRNIISIALLVVVIVTALWFIQSPPRPFQSPPEPDPDALTLVQYFTAMDSVQYDSEGLVEHRFTAQRIEHRGVLSDPEGDTTTIISEPDFIFFEQGQARWQVEADQGRTGFLDAMNEELLLQNNVRVQQITESSPARIATDTLWINPNTKYIHTDAAVKMTSPGFISTGRGLDADMVQERIKILSESKTRYEKPSH